MAEEKNVEVFDQVLNCFQELIDLIRAAEKHGKDPGPKKEALVIKEFYEFLGTLPQDKIPAIFKSEKPIRWLIRVAVFVGELGRGRKGILDALTGLLP